MGDKNSIMDWELLFPKDPRLFAGMQDVDVLSSSFIYFTIFVWLCFTAYILYRGLEYRKWIKRLTSLLQGVKQEELVEKREFFKEKIDNNTYVGKQWNEFDETLVLSHDGRKLFNTVDASYFFNTQNLARGITDSRIISSAPGLLTGMGVLGTFIGLQLGMGSLNLNFANVEDLTKTIIPLVKGATVAFSTSVWGILTSIIFNLSEKTVEAYVRKKITFLQDKIDFLYPRIVEAQELVHINAHSLESRNTMSKLAEQIGFSMQKALDSSLGPAIKQLVDASKELSEKQNLGSQKALTDLAERFMEAMSKEGENQRKNMESGASGLNEAINSVGLSMNEFMQKFNLQLGEWNIEKQGQIELTKNIIEQGNSLSERSEQSQTALENTTSSINQAADKLDNAAGRMERFGGEMRLASESISTKQLEASRLSAQVSQENQSLVNRFMEMIIQIETVRDRFLEISTELKGSSDGIGVRTNEFLENMKTQIENWGKEKNDTQTLANNLINQSQSITNQADQSREALSEIADSIVNSSEKMENASANIAELGIRIESAAEILSSKQAEATEVFKRSSQESLEATNNLRIVIDELQGMRQNFIDVGDSIRESSVNVGQNFDQLNNRVQDHITEMHTSMEDYRDEVNRLISEYSERVNAQTAYRLGEWNHQTLDFSNTLTQAVSSMNDILAEIEEKLQNKSQ
mgnify:FL=1